MSYRTGPCRPSPCSAPLCPTISPRSPPCTRARSGPAASRAPPTACARARADVSPHCRVCMIDGQLVAAVRFTPSHRRGQGRRAAAGAAGGRSRLGQPGLRARPRRQGLEDARAAGIALVVLVGDEPYYGRLGFRDPWGRSRCRAPSTPTACWRPSCSPARWRLLGNRRRARPLQRCSHGAPENATASTRPRGCRRSQVDRARLGDGRTARCGIALLLVLTNVGGLHDLCGSRRTQPPRSRCCLRLCHPSRRPLQRRAVMLLAKDR